MIKKAISRDKKKPLTQVFDYGEFEREAIDGLQSGKGLVGTEGVLTSLIQRLVNAALNGEMIGHLREEKLEGHANRRNGKLGKQLDTELGEISIETPRDRLGKFEPQLVGKWQRQLGTGLDYSTASLSEVTEQVWSEVLAWQQRALQAFYSVIFLDGIYFKTREGGKSMTKVVYSVYGVDSEGRRDVLGVYIRESEGANDWGLILEDLRRRGVEDVLFFCVDGLKGFSDAILEVFPQSLVQRCIVHMVRSSTRFVSDKHIREVCAGLKAIYTAADVTGAEVALSAFKEKWHKLYPDIAKSWEKDWTELVGFLDYTENLRRMIYTTNAVEALHRQIRKVTKTKGSWVNDKALLKQIFLTLQYSDGWSRKVLNWKSIAKELKEKFGERFEKHVW